MVVSDNSDPAEVYERYLGRAIADLFTRVLLEYAAPRPWEEGSRSGGRQRQRPAPGGAD